MSVRISMKVDTSNWDSFQSKLAGDLSTLVFDSIVEAAPDLKDEIESRAPVRTGALKASVTIERESDGVLIYPTVDYAPYVIEGTAPSPGRFVPAIGKRLINPSHPSFGEHPGIAPNSFIEDAAYAGLERFAESFRNYLWAKISKE